MAMLAAVCLGVLALPALAHSQLRTAVPAPDAVVTSPPQELVLEFGQAIRVLPDDIELIGPDGPVAAGPATTAEPTVVTVPLTGQVTDGAHQVRWRVIGADGHPLEGTYGFSVSLPAATPLASPSAGTSPATAPPAPAPPAPTPPATGLTAPAPTATPSGATASATPTAPDVQDTPSPGVAAVTSGTGPGPSPLSAEPDSAPGLPRTVAVVGRWLMYLGVLLVIGVATFGAAVHPEVEADRAVLGRLLFVGGLLAGAASLLQLLARVAVVSGEGMAGVADRDALTIVGEGGLLPAVTLRVAAAIVLVAASRTPSWWRLHGPGTAVLGAVVAMVASFQLVGHTATGQPAALVRIADAIHVLGAGVWAGGAVALSAVVARRRMRGLDSGVVAARFSVVAAAAVVAVGSAGVALAATEVSAPGRLWATGYGRVLLGKLTVVALIAAIGLHNHRRVVPALVDGNDTAAQRLHRMILLEGVAFAGAVALTAVLVGLSP